MRIPQLDVGDRQSQDSAPLFLRTPSRTYMLQIHYLGL